MILTDIPRGNKNSPQYQNQNQLRILIRSMGVPCEANPLQSADAMFEGKGDKGTIGIGVERKALHDFLNCIDDSSYSGHQRILMSKMYQISILMVEGIWRPNENGLLMESKDGCNWFVCRPHGKPVMYSKLRRYLISIKHTGVHVNFTRNLWHTAFDICEEYNYYQKAWDKHTSMREVHKVAIPQMNHKPGLARMWAQDIDGLGVQLSEDAARKFRRPIKLATADEVEWASIPGISAAKAIKIVKQINGW